MMHIANAQDLGHRVRAQRKAQGLTQEALASVSGVGIRFLRELEQGKDSCHFGKVIQVLTMLGMDVFLMPRGGDDS